MQPNESVQEGAVMNDSAGTLRGCESFGAHPFADALPRPMRDGSDQRVLVSGEPDASQFGAGVLDGWPADPLLHGLRIAATESIDNGDFSGHNKYMTTNWFTQPGNKRDRERFANLTEWAQQRVIRVADRLYDGTRTVARCWRLALDAEEETS